MVNASKKNFSRLPAAIYGQSKSRSTQRCHQLNEGKSGFGAERIRAIRALRCLRSEKKHAAEKRREMHFLSNEEEEKWIENYVERETVGPRKVVEDTEAAVQQ